VAANLTNLGIFRQQSAHRTVLRQLQRIVPDDPLNQLLHRSDVTRHMELSVTKVATQLNPSAAAAILTTAPVWCVVERDGEDLYLVRGIELTQWLEQNLSDDGEVDITEAPIRRWTIDSIPARATLRQAMDIMRAQTVEAVCVYRRVSAGNRVLQGIVTQSDIESFSLSRL